MAYSVASALANAVADSVPCFANRVMNYDANNYLRRCLSIALICSLCVARILMRFARCDVLRELLHFL